MNYNARPTPTDITELQLRQFKGVIIKLFQCCQERMQYQSERFGLPEAELRCLMLFGEERYLTAKGIAQRLNVVKSRVTKIVQGLVNKRLIQRVRDPEDTRITLLTLTPQGHRKWKEINRFVDDIHKEVLVQMPPGQRKMLLKDLDLLAASMEAVKDLMV